MVKKKIKKVKKKPTPELEPDILNTKVAKGNLGSVAAEVKEE